MEKIIDKITSYNLFNYLFPGVLFSVALEHITPYSLTHEDLLISVFVYYFVGLVISRFASIVIEPLLRWVHFLKFAEYDDFVAAVKKDPKIELLSEVNNMYRTLVSAVVLLGVAKGYELLSYKVPFIGDHRWWILTITLLLTLLIAYKKQTSYIRKRVESAKD